MYKKLIGVAWHIIAVLGLIFTANAHAKEIISCDLNVAMMLDFYDPSSHENGKVTVVTHRHLTTDMLLLRRGSTGSIAGDLEYTLNKIPNHPQGLDLASRLKMAVKSGLQPPNRKPVREVDCYFMRAVTRNPRVGETYYIWGIHLQREGDFMKSKEMYEKAESLGLDSAEFHYNFGLLYYSLEHYELAKEKADQAYSQGFPLGGLRKKLESSGFYQ